MGHPENSARVPAIIDAMANAQLSKVYGDRVRALFKHAIPLATLRNIISCAIISLGPEYVVGIT